MSGWAERIALSRVDPERGADPMMIGIPVKIVEGDTKNIKITSPEDLLIARALLI